MVYRQWVGQDCLASFQVLVYNGGPALGRALPEDERHLRHRRMDKLSSALAGGSGIFFIHVRFLGRFLAVLLLLLLLAGCRTREQKAPGANRPSGAVSEAGGSRAGVEPGRVSGPEPEERRLPGGFGLQLMIEGLEEPVYVTHAGDGSGRLFIVERRGKVRMFARGRLAEEPFADLSSLITHRGAEQGLLGMAFSPLYPEEPFVFFSYTARDGSSVLARFRVDPGDPGRVEPASREELLRVPQPYSNHNGGHIAFGPDGYLYFGLGDGGSAGDPQGNAQNPGLLLGKILRLDVSEEGRDKPEANRAQSREEEGREEKGYRLPPDNPFAGRPGWRPEIWALGLRNPWRFSFDRVTGDLYIADVGQDSREEINFEPAGSPGGRNYGWNAWEGTLRYRTDVKPGTPVTFPVAEYATRQEGCSVTGGYVYRGRRIPVLWGIYIFGDFCSGRIWGLRRTGGAWKMGRLLDTEARISSFGEDEEGELYVVDYGGRVLSFVPGDVPVPEELR